MLLLLLGAALAAEPSVGSTLDGAGGPFLQVAALRLDGQTYLVLSPGGAGYSYHLGGRLRLGGFGQGTSASSLADGATAEHSWGGLLVGVDPLSSPRWELPLTLWVGGGGWSVDRSVSEGPPEVVEHSRASGLVVQASLGVDYRLSRTLKAALTWSATLGLDRDLPLSGSGLALWAVFCLPADEGH